MNALPIYASKKDLSGFYCSYFLRDISAYKNLNDVFLVDDEVYLNTPMISTAISSFHAANVNIAFEV